MQARHRALLLLSPEAYGTHGGVQAYTRRLAEILSDFGQQFGYGLNSVSYLDRAFDPLKHVRPVQYRRFHGGNGRKLVFVRQAALTCMQDSVDTAVAAHIRQAPVAWALKIHGLVRRYVLVLHGIEVWRRVNWVQRMAAAGADRIVATTDFTADLFCRLNGIPRSHVAVIPLCLAESEIAPPLSSPAASNVLRILSVGRITFSDRYKGYDNLIEAVHLLRTRGLPATLDIVGAGDDMPRLKEHVAHLHLDEQAVKFSGSVSDTELQAKYQACDVFALPSGGEGFGIVFLEAMRYGKPCIGGNHGGTPEVIGNAVTGFLVEHGNTGDLADRLAFLHANPEARADMGRRAYECVRSTHLYPQMRERWYKLLSALTEDELCAELQGL